MNSASVLADVILHHGKVTTLDRSNPTAVAVRDGRFVRVGADADVLALAGPATKIIDLKGRRVLPGCTWEAERENRPGEAGVRRTAVPSTGPLSHLCSTGD
jgi:hypothetical protein